MGQPAGKSKHEIKRQGHGRWAKGQSGNPQGRPRSGRGLALEVLDELLEDAGNLKKLRANLQEMFDTSPSLFFREYVMPLVPKESLVQLETSVAVPVRVVLEQAQEGAE